MTMLSRFQRHFPNRKPRRPKTERPRARRPWLEALEERTLLSAPAPFPASFFGSGGQLGSAPTQTVSTFLGDKFSSSSTIGHIYHTAVGSYGADATLGINGEAGLQLAASVNSGSVAAAFNEVLNQNYAEPTAFGQVVNFGMNSGTYPTYLASAGSGPATGFSTTVPSVSASADLELGLGGSLGAHFALVHTTDRADPQQHRRK